MEKNVWLAVPTYWTHPRSAPGEERSIFDHPTPLDGEGTLARALASFRRLEGRFRVLLVAAAAHPDLGEAVHRRVLELAGPFARDFPLYLASPVNLPAVERHLPEPILRLDTYGNIRNVQLALPFAMGADAVVGIDDDEVIEDPAYLAKVTRWIGEEHEGGFVGGMAGPYLDRTGDYRIPGAEELARLDNLFLKKNFFMNEALGKVMEAPRRGEIVRSNVAFGGNMAMARRTIARACHDPYIPRGEDYDYVLNAAMEGICFYFQPAMAVIHLPPDSTGPQAADKPSKLLADIRRFIYMREKVRRFRGLSGGKGLDMDYFHPYPGPYLAEDVDLEAHAVRAIDEGCPGFRGHRSPEEFVAEAAETAREKAEEFFGYREKWRRMTKAIAHNAPLRRTVESLKVR